VFRKIEYWIEGDYKHQMKLKKQSWNAEKIRKKGLKHLIFFAISLAIAHTFLAYIIGADELIKLQTEPVSENMSSLISMLIFTFVFYGVFAWFREQVCIVACPYGRLQGVMLDRNSIVVAYDYIRGEKRGKFRKNEDRDEVGKGDCIDCHQCVDVCPTGIDIRNGTQLECVNCTACIVACDHMMESVGLPKGLIRYDSEEGITSETKKSIFTTRSIAYMVVLAVLLGVMGFLLTERSEMEALLLRSPGMLYQEKGEGKVSNVYTLNVVNKSRKEMKLEIKVLNLDADIEILGEEDMILEPEGTMKRPVFIIIARDDLQKMKTEIELGIFSGGRLVESTESSFFGPAK